MTAVIERPVRLRAAAREIAPGSPDETLSIVSSALIVVFLVCGWMLLQLLVLGGAAESRSQHLLFSEYRSELAQATAPTGQLDYEGDPVKPGAPVALLTIPSLDTEQVVVNGTAPEDLLAGPGLMRSTVIPGQQGISVVFGRASTYGAPFRSIATLEPGDEIDVQNAEGSVVYRVTDVRRAGDDIPAAPTGTEGRLTLVTAESAGHLAALRPRDVVYVDATAEKATGTGVVAAAVPSSELPMGRDTSGLPTLALLLGLLVALVFGVGVARRHFRGVLVWSFATPAALALAWAVTEQVMRLLPNLM